METIWINATDVRIGDCVVNYRRNERSYPSYSRDFDHKDRVVGRIVPGGKVRGFCFLYSASGSPILTNDEFTQVKVIRKIQPANEGMAKRFEDIVKSLTSSPTSP